MTSEEDIVIRLRRTRASMIGTSDEGHYFDVQEAADYIEKLRKAIDSSQALITTQGSFNITLLEELHRMTELLK